MTAAIARVFINHIEVGSLPADQYQAIVEQVHRDRRLLAAQGLNLLAALGRMGCETLLTLPRLWVLILAVLVFAAPATLSDTISAFRDASSQEAALMLRNLLTYSVFANAIVLLARGVLFAPGRWYGLANEFSAAIGRRVRGLLEVASEGDVEVRVERTDRA